MSDHDLSPAQYAASVGLSPETLEQAAEAVAKAIEEYGQLVEDYDERKEADLALHATLTILVPAIREALVREMIAEFDKWLWVQSDMPEDAWWGGAKTGIREATLIARAFLAAQGGAS